MVLLQIWNGLSSVGGLFGFMVGVFWFLHKRKQPFLIFVDMLCFGMLVGFTTGRLGCALVHDHPGTLLTGDHPLSFLAVHGWNNIEAQVRWDLGLLEFLYLVPIVAYMHLGFPWKTARPGRLVGVTALLYGPFRLFLDSFRAEDKTYLGMTPAQYFTIAMLAIGVYFTFLRKPKASDLAWSKESEYQAARKAKIEAERAAEATAKAEAKAEADD